MFIRNNNILQHVLGPVSTALSAITALNSNVALE